MPAPIDALVHFLVDVHARPAWVRLWTAWMAVVIVAAPVVMWRYGAARRDHLPVAVSTVVLLVAVPLWYAQAGDIRLMGLPHLPIWTAISGDVWP